MKTSKWNTSPNEVQTVMFECKCRLQVSVERSGPQLEALFRVAVETLGDGAELEQ